MLSPTIILCVLGREDGVVPFIPSGACLSVSACFHITERSNGTYFRSHNPASVYTRSFWAELFSAVRSQIRFSLSFWIT
jgi:hypothetical protein